MAKLFEKLGLIEKVNPSAIQTEELSHQETNYEETPTENKDLKLVTKNVSTSNFASDVYENSGLSDLSKSIFKLEEISKQLPDTMPEATKKISVLGIISSFGLTIEEILADGANRLEVLQATKDEIIQENEAVINANKESIEEAKSRIQFYESNIVNSSNAIKETINSTEEEVSRIKNLINLYTN